MKNSTPAAILTVLYAFLLLAAVFVACPANGNSPKVDAGVTELEFTDGGLVEKPDAKKDVASYRVQLAVNLHDVSTSVSKKTGQKWDVGLVHCQEPATSEEDMCVVVFMNEDDLMFTMIFVRKNEEWSVLPKLFK